MPGHPSDSDLIPTEDLFSTTPEIDISQESATRYIQDVQSQDRLQDEFTPATALDFGQGLDSLDQLDFKDYLDYMNWDVYYPSMLDDVDPKRFQEPNDVDDEIPKDKSIKGEFDAWAAQPESHSSLGTPYDLSNEAAAEQPLDMRQCQGFSSQVPNPASQEIFDPAESFVSAAEEFADLFGISDALGRDLDGSLRGDFELPDKSSELNFLQDLHVIGKEPQLAMSPDIGYNTQELPYSTAYSAIQNSGSMRIVGNGSSTANGVALAGSSEPNPENMSRAVLTNPRRLYNAHLGVATQRQPNISRIQIHRNKLYIENSAYTPLAEAPKAWDVFEYTKEGELDPSRLFSADEISRFLFTHPLHRGQRNLKDSPLKLRVHKTPASSAKRFPNGLFCRFKDCPMRTINQGQLLIVVDELSIQHPDHDFYLNAAYFHLWCMERYSDFPAICANLDVTAEGRKALKEEGRKNRFTIGGEGEKVVEDFVACCTDGRRKVWVARCPDQQTSGIGCPHYDPQSLPYNGTLCHQLTITKLHYGGQGRINLRMGREEKAGYQGANIIRHLGDLSKEVEMREFSRTHKNQNQLKINPKTGRQYRNDGNEKIEDEQLSHSHAETNRQPILQQPEVDSPDQAHGTKWNYDGRSNGQILDDEIVQARKKSRSQAFKIPVWNSNQSTEVGLGTQRFQDTTSTPGISPRTTIDLKPQQLPSQMQMTATSPRQDDQSSFNTGPWSSTSEDISDGEIELAIIAAQRKRRLLEIEDAKDKEKECRLMKLKLQKAIEQKRARDERDDDGYRTISKGKRQKVW